MADREGFEPSNGFHRYTLSRRTPSTTRPPVHAREGGATPARRRPARAGFPPKKPGDSGGWRGRAALARVQPQSAEINHQSAQLRHKKGQAKFPEMEGIDQGDQATADAEIPECDG